jgi:hypothetical protein
VLRDHTAGDPMREGVIWANLTPGEIARRLKDKGTPASVPVVRGLLRRHRYARREAQKRLATRRHKGRDGQFRNTARLRALYEASANPVVSVDTKKKEFLGNLYRAGKLYTREELRTLDHDFPSDAEGVVIPHGLYDLKRDHGHVNPGASRDTSRFACDSLAAWWRKHGAVNYPGATSLLLPCDGGGSNSGEPARVQGGAARAGGPAGVGDPGGSLPSGRLEVQPDRAPGVPARDAGLPGGGVHVGGAGEGAGGEGRGEGRAGGDGGCQGGRIPGGGEGARRVQAGDEDCIRRDAAEVELPRHPQTQASGKAEEKSQDGG